MKEISNLKYRKNINLRLRNSIKSVNWDPILAFVFTFFLITIMCLARDIAPFGNGSILNGDLITQYAPYILTWNDHLEEVFSSGGEHFISHFSYSDNLGAGKNIFSTLGYYTASPFNLLAYGMESTEIASFVLLSVALKLSLSASFMTILTQRVQKNRESHFPLVLGISYAFSMYSMIYMFNIMWLDAYALLPLLLFFVEKYLDDNLLDDGSGRLCQKKLDIGMILVLIVLFITQFYIAYMVGIFSFLYLIMRLVEKKYCEGLSLSLKGAVKIIGTFVMNAGIAALLVAFYLFPVAFDILNNGDSTNLSYVMEGSREESILGVYLFDFLEMFFIGRQGNESLSNNNPFIFVGLFVTLSLVIFFVSKRIDRKSKVIYGSMLLFMAASFSFEKLDIAWHAFDNPNWFEHRYSFCFLPIFLIITMKVYNEICNRQISVREILSSLGIALITLVLVQTFGSMYDKDVTFLYNAIFLVIYALVFIGMQKVQWHEQLKNMQKISFALFVLFAIVEVVFIKLIVTSGFCGLEKVSDNRLAKIDIAAYEDLAEIAKDNNAIRIESEMESNYMPDPNAANYANYNSISIFNTSTNKAFTRLLRNLGLSTNYNLFYVDYNYSSMPIDSFFGIGSIISSREYTDAEAQFFADLNYDRFNENLEDNSEERDAENDVEEDLEDFLYLYRNPFALGLGFPVANEAMNFNINAIETEYENKNYFDWQNMWYKSLFEDCFEDDIYLLYEESFVGEPVLINGVTYPEHVFDDSTGAITTFENDFCDTELSQGRMNEDVIYVANPQLPLVMQFEFKAQYSGEHYINISSTTVLNQTTVYLGEEEIADFAKDSYMSTIVRLGYFEEGETISVTISSDNKTAYRYLAINFACLDHEYFASEMEQVLANAATGVTMTDYEQGYVTFNTNLNEGQMLLTTIPYEDGWTCYVDGVEREISPYQDALIAVDVGSGEHEVVFKFVAPGLFLGGIVSIVTLGILIVAVSVGIVIRSRSKNNNK